MECLAECSTWDVECQDECINSAPMDVQIQFDDLLDCLDEAGVWECGSDEDCMNEAWAACMDLAQECTNGPETCPDLYACAKECPELYGVCSGKCTWNGTVEAQNMFLAFLDCLGVQCPDGFGPDCAEFEAVEACSAEAEACFGECAYGCIGKECGSDGCDGICGNGNSDTIGCPNDLPVCDETMYECGPCVPDCAGKECGGDGCDGECGVCDDGAECVDGKCLAPELDYAEQVEQAAQVEQAEVVEPAALEDARHIETSTGDAVEQIGGETVVRYSDGADRQSGDIPERVDGQGTSAAGCGGCASAEPDPVRSGAAVLLVLLALLFFALRSSFFRLEKQWKRSRR